MKIEIIIDKLKNFLGLIHNLNCKSAEFQDYILKDTFKNYKIPSEMRRELREIMFLENSEEIIEKIKNNEILNKIYEENKGIWDDFWEENGYLAINIKEELEQQIKKYDFDVFKKIGYFFGGNLPEKITLNLYLGATSLGGKGNLADFKKGNTFMFPRQFQKFNSNTIQSDFGILLHEMVHFTQNEIYFSDKKEFLEAVTRTFAPKGILFREELIVEGSVEKKFAEIIKEALKKNKTFFEVRESLIEEYNAKKCQP